MKGTVRLRYCVVNDDVRHVSDFAHLSPKQRPEAFCPECDNRLVLKLGNSDSPNGKAHHAAHKAENLSCSLSSPEGALHFNTKRYIYEQLKQGTELYIKQTCSGWTLNGFKQNCCRLYSATRPYLWLKDWDDVQMERNVRSLRPDIVLYRNARPVAAIEICVTHRVDDEKQAKLQEIGLPWIEVKAEGDEIDEYFVNWANGYEEEDIPWKIEKPLIYNKCRPLPEEWSCDGCLTEPKDYAERLKKYEEAEALREARAASERLKKISEEKKALWRKLRYTKDQDNHVIKAKAIVLLKPFGETQLLELFVMRRDGSELPYNPEEIYLKLGRIGGEILISEEPITENSKRVIFEFYKTWIKNKERRYQEIFHLTEWLVPSDYEKQVKNYTLPKEWVKFRGWVLKSKSLK